MSELDRRQFLRAAGTGAVALGAAGQLELAEALAEVEAEASGKVGKKAIRQLRRSVHGRVLTRGDNGYGRARKVFNSRYDDKRPDAVLVARGVSDVQAVIRWANRHDVRLTARSGGHSYAGYSTTGNGVVVDLSKLNRVQASNGSKRATVGAGVPLLRMYSKLAKKGMTVPGGSCPTVGITGLALGGGMGFASRELGLTCDNITGISIVTPDGKFRQITERSDPGLFWACQGGGGGNFGIVTSLTFRTHRARRAAYFTASWPWSEADHALNAWQRFAPEAPAALSSTFSLLTGSGSPFAAASGQFFGSKGELRKLLKPLEDVDGIRLTVGSEDYLKLMLRWAGCAGESVSRCSKPHPRSFYAGSDYFDKRVNSGGRERMIDAISQRQGQGGSGALLLDAYGGKINKVGSRATAFVHRDQLFAVQYYAEPGSSGNKRTSNWIKRTRRRLGRYTSGQAYQNYIDPNLKGWKKAYYGRNYQRLVDVKTRYDPDNRLRFRQGIPPRN